MTRHNEPKPGLDGRYLYFAFGSNMASGQMRSRAFDAVSRGPAKLGGYRLVFRGVADVEAHAGAEVHGALWSITPDDLRALDRYEGHPSLYGRRVVRVQSLFGPVDALVYEMRHASDQSAPSPFYLDIIIEGAVEFDVPLREVHDALRRSAAWLKANRIRRVRIDGRRTRPIYPHKATPIGTWRSVDFDGEDETTDRYWSHWSRHHDDEVPDLDELEAIALERYSWHHRDEWMEDVDG